MEGFFRITFTGVAGSGFGMLALYGGVAIGADVAGGIYDGFYTDNTTTKTLDFRVTMKLPAGATPVQTGVVLSESTNLPICVTIPHANMIDGTPILLKTPLGPVNVAFVKLREFTITSG